MSFTLTQHTDAPIIVNHLHADYTMAEFDPANQKAGALLDKVTEPHYYIVIFDFTLTLEELLEGASGLARSENSLWHHPNIKQVIMVTDNDLFRLSAKGMHSDVFGNLDIAVFSTLEDALAYTRVHTAN
ncbi:MAG: hypothetical protein SFZ02_11910 [bacterium]|nr:hypothetical protein [bacterium]